MLFTKQDSDYNYYLIVNDLSIISMEVKNKLTEAHIVLFDPLSPILMLINHLPFIFFL